MDEHTKLINMVLGFTTDEEDWPNLFNKFEVCSIDKSFNNNEQNSICPDVILSSKYYNSIILFECKSKKQFTEKDEKQLKNYLTVNYDDVKHLVDVVSPKDVKIELSYVISNNFNLVNYFNYKNK